MPRHRAFIEVFKATVPRRQRRRVSVFECSPGTPSSEWLYRACNDFKMSHLYPDIPAGQYDSLGVRSEDLQCMTLDDNSIDVFVTQDVLEHVADPDAAFREIARVLVPGGVHIWTVPIFARGFTVRRAEADGDGGIRHLLEPDYHRNPLGGGALVFHEWGADITDRVDRVGGVHTTRHSLASRMHGIAGEMSDVLVSRNP